MASRLIVTRQQLTSALHAAFTAFAGETSPVLGERLAPFLDDEDSGFDFGALQGALARMIAASVDQLVAADKAHLDELTGDGAPRHERDRRVQAVRAKLIDVRRIAAGLFGLARAREIVAVDGATAEQPELLWRQAEHTMSRLRDPDLQLPPASTGAVTFNAAALADELEPLVTALREAIDGCELDVRQAALTLQVKQEAMAEHDRLMSACGRILSGLCLLAERPDLARRVRVTPPRVRRDRQRSRDNEELAGNEAAATPESPPPVTVESPRPGKPRTIETGGAPVSRDPPPSPVNGASRRLAEAAPHDRPRSTTARRRVAGPPPGPVHHRADDL
jgi:hypothetical protein